MSINDLAFLGLSHNPFQQTGDAFYPGGQRKRLLDQLSHLSQWSRRSLLVTGVAGSGKTTLFDHLASSMEPKAFAAKVQGEVATSRRDVLAAAAKSFGVDAADDAQADVLDELIRSFVEEQQRADRLCVVLVDDAHRLDSRAIEMLLRLSLDCKVRIVMFAEPSVSRMVEEIGASLDIACHETQLIGFGQADVRGYLEWRFEQANYRGRVPFTDAQVETIAKVSSGLPGRIDELAGQELQRLGSGEPEEAESSFPVTHRLLVGMLVVVFGLLYLLVSGGGEESDSQLPAADLASTAVEGGEAVLEQGDSAVASGDPSVAMQPATEPASSTRRPSATPLPAQQPNNQAQVVQPALSLTQEESQTAAADTAAKTLAEQTAAAKVAAAEAAAEAAAAAEAVAARKRAEEQQRQQAAAAAAAEREQQERERRELAEREAQAREREAAQVAEATRNQAQPPSALANQNNAGQSERWLLQQDPQSYTLQLFTLSSADGAARYIARQENPERFATYMFRRAGKQFYVVVYGLFASRAAASAASVQLPAQMDVKEPWIRPLAQIQATIRAVPAA